MDETIYTRVAMVLSQPMATGVVNAQSAICDWGAMPCVRDRVPLIQVTPWEFNAMRSVVYDLRFLMLQMKRRVQLCTMYNSRL